MEAERFTLIFLEGRGVVRGWPIMAKKLRDLGFILSEIKGKDATAEVEGGEQKAGNACRRIFL